MTDGIRPMPVYRYLYSFLQKVRSPQLKAKLPEGATHFITDILRNDRSRLERAMTIRIQGVETPFAVGTYRSGTMEASVIEPIALAHTFRAPTEVQKRIEETVNTSILSDLIREAERSDG